MTSIALRLRRASWVLVFVLAACGGDGGSAPPGGASGAGSDAVIGQQLDSLDAVAGHFAALTLETPDVDAQAMLAWMSTRPEFVDPEIVEPGVVAYNFADGTPGIVDLRRRIENPGQLATMAPGAIGLAATEARRSAQAVRVLERRRAFLFDALTASLGEQSWAVISGLSAWLRAAGFAVDTTAFTTPTSLLSVNAADLLYIDAHGGVGRYERSGGERFYAIATAVPVNKETLALFKDAITARQVAIYGVPELFDPASLARGWRMLSYISITPEFVRRNMTFNAGALVFVNGCEFMAAGDEFKKMRDAFRAVGATNLLGWDTFTEATYAAESALYLFDRMLGANGYAPFISEPAHRPFDLPAVLRAMARVDRKNSNDLVGTKTFLKLDTSALWKSAAWGGWQAKLTHEAPSGDILSLSPSISLVTLDNATATLTIYGLFGDPSTADRSITIGGTDMTSVATWSPTRIIISPLPRSGAGSAGPVEVRVGGGRSNTTWINAWSGVQISNFHPLDGGNGFGDNTARIVTTCTVDFRAATGAFRTAPDTAVNQPATNGDPTIQPGICSYTAGGRYTGALGTIDLRVVGSPSMPWLDPPGRLAPELPARRAWVQAQFNAVDRSMYLQMFHYIAPGEGGGPQQTLTALDGQVTVVPPVGLDETAASGNNPARFDAQGNLQPGSNQQTSQYMTWSGAAAAYQEDSRAGR